MNARPSPSGHRRRRAGFTLAHVLIALPLLGLFAVVSTQLLRATWRASSEMRIAAESAARLDGALHRLRADAWGASELSAEGAAATIRTPDGATVVWRTDPVGGTLTRVLTPDKDRPASAASQTVWKGLPPGIALAADGPALRVSMPNPTAGRTADVTMASQLLLQRGKQ